jgi:hypothetical protein
VASTLTEFGRSLQAEAVLHAGWAAVKYMDIAHKRLLEQAHLIFQCS